MGDTVPEVLLSGHHKNIEKWRRQKSLETTLLNRPDLLSKAGLDKEDLHFLEGIENENT
ncbi:tRNA (guanine-N(1)-)-methyltransferase [bioreactor metagenome]|uniref:tRNA (guanine-N(1)-)-methyltransferase n=1 Tax=bioreactor metagenome TaxID=1076179 RepID=A0A645GGG7_9ZZZZ